MAYPSAEEKNKPKKPKEKEHRCHFLSDSLKCPICKGRHWIEDDLSSW